LYHSIGIDPNGEASLKEGETTLFTVQVIKKVELSFPYPLSISIQENSRSILHR
jgi:hypothetical protein